ncbi:MAG: copper chaperone PCu(A)C [Betaproteobacteria bacterium]|nr:copper chaperone PCu(A)C [Betaproteobacteria bacterium]
MNLSIPRRVRFGMLNNVSRRILLLAVLAVPFAHVARAADVEVKVDNARIRLLPGNLPLAGYFDITNTGKSVVVLEGASSSAFHHVMMHRSVRSNGQSEMHHVDSLELAPGQSLHFEPEGLHLMLMHRTRKLAVGDQVPITLMFEGDRTQEVVFTVRGAGTQ